MYKIVFLILHYQVLEQTKNCIESIKSRLNNNEYEIVVVDNNSQNGTGKQLQDLYKDETNIHIILNDKNLGFANGNNIGFKYAKDKLNADFIAMINNDTCIMQDNFFEIIKEEYEKSNFAVMGPKIILLNNAVNPVNDRTITLEYVKKEIRSLIIKLMFNYLHLEEQLEKIKLKIKKAMKTDDIDNNKEVKSPDLRYENIIILHGCCLIFSPTYIKKFDGIDDRTFLYHEEELLSLRLKQNKLLSVYNPNLLIFHEENAATNSIMKSPYKKRRFVYKNMLKSDKILLSELKKDIRN